MGTQKTKEDVERWLEETGVVGESVSAADELQAVLSSVRQFHLPPEWKTWSVKGYPFGRAVRRVFRDRLLKVDHTWRRSERERQLRHSVGPPWENHSCAVDSVLMLALYLDVGITRFDQAGGVADPKLPDQENILAWFVWNFCRNDWSLGEAGEGPEPTLVEEKMKMWRELIIARYLDLDGGMRRGSLLPIADVWTRLMHPPAQMTWQHMRAQVCMSCGEFDLLENPRHEQSCKLELTNVSTGGDEAELRIQNLVQRMFDERRFANRLTLECPCGGTRSYMPLVASELPPRLVVEPLHDVLRGLTSPSECDFRRFTVHYHCPEHNGPAVLKKAHYRLCGMIHHADSHFWVSAQPFDCEDWLTYDGLKTGKLRVKRQKLDDILGDRLDRRFQGSPSQGTRAKTRQANKAAKQGNKQGLKGGGEAKQGARRGARKGAGASNASGFKIDLQARPFAFLVYQKVAPDERRWTYNPSN